MYGKIAEHDEGEHDAVFGLALGRCADELDKGGAPQPGFLKARTGRNWPVWWGAGRSRRLPFSVGDAVLQSLLFVNVVPEEGSVEREVPTEASTGVADAQELHPLAPEFPLDCCTCRIEEALFLLLASQMGGTALGQDAAESSEQQAPDRHGHRNDLPWGLLGYHGEKFILKA